MNFYDLLLAKKLSGGGGGGGGGGSTEAPWNDVCFWDYDGRCLYSYSAEEFASLTALPANPKHQGLTAQGWNWSLTDAKSHVATYGMLDIGQLYVTDDGTTRIYISVDDMIRPDMCLTLKCSVASALTLDWGDGSATETNSGTSITVYHHTYAAKGQYTIKLSVSSGTMTLGNGNAINALPAGDAATVASRVNGSPYEMWSRNFIHAIEFGNNVVLAKESLTFMGNIETITMPTTITYADGGNYFKCSSMKILILPNPYGVSDVGGMEWYCGKVVCLPKQTEFKGSWGTARSRHIRRICIPIRPTGNQMFTSGCQNLESIIFSENATELYPQFMQEPYSLRKLVIPAGLTKINGFESNGYLYSLKEVHCLSSTPPTLGGTYFGRTPADFKIYVPTGSLSTYQSASNWSTYSSYMVEE